MRTFSDTQGRQWSVDLNIGAIKRVKSLVGVDLLQTKDGQLLISLADDPVKLADVLFAIVQPQAQSRGVSDEDFGAALGGDTIRLATEAFVEELIDFFLKFQPTIGRTLQMLWTKLGLVVKKAGELADAKLQDPRVDRMIERQWVKAEADIESQFQTILGD